MEQRLEKLLIEKPFTALNAEERKYALERLTKDEYEECRTLLVGAKLALRAKWTGLYSRPQPDKAFIEALLARQSGKDTIGLFNSRRNRRRVLLAAGSLVIASLGALWLTFRPDVRRDASIDLATHYLKNGMDQNIMTGMHKRNTKVSLTNGYLLSNDSLFRALDRMNDYMVIRQDGPEPLRGQDK